MSSDVNAMINRLRTEADRLRVLVDARKLSIAAAKVKREVEQLNNALNLDTATRDVSSTFTPTPTTTYISPHGFSPMTSTFTAPTFGADFGTTTNVPPGGIEILQGPFTWIEQTAVGGPQFISAEEFTFGAVTGPTNVLPDGSYRYTFVLDPGTGRYRLTKGTVIVGHTLTAQEIADLEERRSNLQ